MNRERKVPPTIPEWVGIVYDHHFSYRRGKKKPKRHSPMASSIPHDADATKYVDFTVEQGTPRAQYTRPLEVVSPHMITCFPKLTESQMQQGTGDSNNNNNRLELDITMKGAKAAQEQFRKLIDGFDDHLFEFVFANQGTILPGKKYTKDQLSMMHKRQFKQRVSVRNGRSYPDAMNCRFKGAPGTRCPVIDQNLEEADPEWVQYNSVVRAGLRYNGCYMRAGFFGNSWELTCVQYLGQHTDTSNHQAVDASTLFSAHPINEAEWPCL
jgi:hypothetical protein